MGTTAEKGARVLQSIAEVQEGINNLGGSLTDQTPFKDFKAQLDNIYDRLPKTEYQEGTEITLSNTLKGKLDFEDGIVGYGDTKQEIDLTENNLTSQSANGLNIVVGADKSITINGTATANTTINILNNTSNNTPATERTLQAGTYSLTGCPSGSSSGAKFKLDVVRSGYITLEDIGNGAIETITSSQTYTYIRILIYSGTVCNNLVFRPKLLKIPSPSYPQEIEVVRGKNRFNGIYVNALTGGASPYPYTENNDCRSAIIKVEPNTTYTISKSTSNRFRISEYSTQPQVGANATNYIQAGDSETQYTLTTQSTTKYVLIQVTNQNEENVKLQLEEGTSATPYLPYNTIEEVVSGKNVLNTLNLEPKTENGITYTPVYKNGLLQYINVNGTSTAVTFYDIPLITEANTDYFLNGCPSGGSYGTYRQMIIDTTDFTTSFNDYGSGVLINSSKTNWSFRIRIASGITINDMKFYPMVSKGSTATTYEPYITPTSYQLSLGDIELNAIGNYKDELIYDVDEDKVYKNEVITRKILTGANTEFWQVNAITGAYVFAYGVTNYKRTNELICICNYFKAIANGTYGSMTDGQCRFRYYNDELYNFYVCMDDITNVNDFRTWLGTHNLDLYYVLATPTETEITDSTLKQQVKNWYYGQSLNGTTIVTGSGNLPMVIKIRALKGE